MGRSKLGEFLAELRRRRVYRAGAFYLAGAYLVIEVADTIGEAVGLGEAGFRALVLLAGVGFPVVVALAWLYELNVDEADASSTEEGAPATGISTPLARAAVLAFVIAGSAGGGIFAWKSWLQPSPDAAVAGAAEATLLPPERIAVLYLDDLSPDGDLEYLAAGLTETLIHDLAQVQALDVASRTGVKPFREQDLPMDSIATLLRAGTLVEGSVMRSGDRLRVVIQLIDGETNAHLASWRFDPEEAELFRLQDQILDSLSGVLRTRIGEFIEVQTVRRQTDDVQAWRLVQEAQLREDAARDLWRDDPEGAYQLFGQARDLLATAALRDAEWALPQARMARVMAAAVQRRGSQADGYAALAVEALSIADAAITLDSTSADAWTVRGNMLHALASLNDEDGSLGRAAGEAFETAVALDPSNARAWVGFAEWLIPQGRAGEAAAAARRAIQEDQFLLISGSALNTYWYAALQDGPTEEAREICDFAYRQFPDYAFVQCQLFLLTSFPDVAPDLDRAWRLLDSLQALSAASIRGDAYGNGLVQVAKVAARAGLADSARAVAASAGEYAPPEILAYDRAHLEVILGDYQGAIQRLRRLVDVDGDSAYYASDWYFEALRTEPDWALVVGESRAGG